MTDSLGKKIVSALKQHSDGGFEPAAEVEVTAFEAAPAVQTMPEFSAAIPAPVELSPVYDFAPTPVAVQPAIAPAMPEEDEFDTPANVKVLKQLMTQLPPGITKQTGAAIVKQTMEALGIPMKSVLLEAQAFQDNLTAFSEENRVNIVALKQQITDSELTIKKIQKQVNNLHDIISLFAQIG